MDNITAPYIDNLILTAKHAPCLLDTETMNCVDSLFQTIQAIAVCGEDERRVLWISAVRGEIDDFGDYEEYLEEGEVESREEFTEWWLSKYPEDHKWYKLVTMIYQDVHYVFLDDTLVLQTGSDDSGMGYGCQERSELAFWLSAAAERCVQELKAGTYNEMLARNLPYKKRIGKILRNDYWSIFPEEKAAYLEDIAPQNIELFCETVQARPETSTTRLSEMTAGVFFDCCALGYRANQYSGLNGLTPKEQYEAHADGRHDGLLAMKEDSAEEFSVWFHESHKGGGHPWEVCRGGNSTHISLYPNHDELGWYFTLRGSSYARSVETVNFYLALANKGIPIYLTDGKEIAAMLTGRDYIGIVPENVTPRYCDSMFPGEKMLQYMNLPFENTEKVIKAAEWYPLDEVKLAD